MKIFWSVVVLVLGIAVCFVNDVYLKQQELTGVDTHSWDVVGTILIGLGCFGFFVSVFDKE